MQSENQKFEVVRFIKWLFSNQEVKFVLCDRCEDIATYEILEVLEKLEDQGYYQIIIILLLRYKYLLQVENALGQAFADLLNTEDTDIENVLKDIKLYIEKDIKKL